MISLIRLSLDFKSCEYDVVSGKANAVIDTKNGSEIRVAMNIQSQKFKKYLILMVNELLSTQNVFNESTESIL